MLTQNQISKIREFFSQDIIQLETEYIICEHVYLFSNYYITLSSAYALDQLWKNIDLLSESKQPDEEKECKDCIDKCKCS